MIQIVLSFETTLCYTVNMENKELKALIFNIQKFSLHDGFGIRSTVFFKGCNLRCPWCSNPESQSCLPETMGGAKVGRYYSLREVLDEVLKDKAFYERSGGGVTLSGGEPLLQKDFVCALCRALRDEGVSTAIETAACVPPETFKAVFDCLEFAQVDIKHYNKEKHKAVTGISNELAIENLRWALRQDKRVIPRIPVIPGFNDSLGDAEGFKALLNELGATEVQILPFHQLGESKYDKLGKAYKYKGIDQLHDEDLLLYAETLGSAGLKVQIGG